MWRNRVCLPLDCGGSDEGWCHSAPRNTESFPLTEGPEHTELLEQKISPLAELFCWKVAAMYKSKNLVIKFNFPICALLQVWLTAVEQKDKTAFSPISKRPITITVVRGKKTCRSSWTNCINATWYSWKGRFHFSSSSVQTYHVIMIYG